METAPLKPLYAPTATKTVPKACRGSTENTLTNDGVSFSSSSIPSLIDRHPDRIQIEPHLNRGASYNAYPGLDDRFKQHWGARFGGLIDVPHAGNWTFFINSDDGSELWVNGASLAQNYGMHGMRERSGWLNLSEGLHEFRIEFFQGGAHTDSSFHGRAQTPARRPSLHRRSMWPRIRPLNHASRPPLGV